jgi:hypothetical protein
MAKKREGRGRLSSIETLPPEANDAVEWAARELAKREKTQEQIREEFNTKLKIVNPEFGEISRSAFNRYSIRMATMTRRLRETHEIAKSLSDQFNAERSDDLTVMAAEAIKTLVFELLGDGGESGMTPSDAQRMAMALKQATQAQHISTDRRARITKEMNEAAATAIDKVGKKKGLTKEVRQQFLAEFLGVTNT